MTEGTRRLFLAADLSDTVRAQMGDLAARLARRFDARGIDGFTFVDTANLHITLHFLGNVDNEAEARLRDALAVPLGVRPFDVSLRGLGTFPPGGGARVLWVAAADGAADLSALHRETGGRLKAAGARLDPRPFSAHLTLARRRLTTGRRRRPFPVEALAVDVPLDCRWHVDHVTLYESRLSPHGPRYEARLIVPLAGPPSP